MWFGLHLTTYYILDFLTLGNNYIFTILLSRRTSATALLIEGAYRFVSSILFFTLCYTLVFVYHSLIKKQIRRSFKNSYFTSGSLLILTLTVIAIFSVANQSVIPILLANIIVVLTSALILIVTLIFLLIKIRDLENKRNPESNKNIRDHLYDFNPAGPVFFHFECLVCSWYRFCHQYSPL